MYGSPYVSISRLGAGSSEVWLAVLDGAEGFRRPVVLKIARDPAARLDLAREGRVMAALRHPSVVTAHDLFEADHALVLALEHVPGTTLRTLIAHLEAERARAPWAVSCRIVADVARGLAHAHAATDPWGRALGVVHRDVTPSNVLVGEDGRARIADFGIAHRALVEATRLGVVRGTLGFLSPEQAAGRVIDARSDVFSLGAVLYELLSGVALGGAEPVRALEAVRRGLGAPPAGVPAAVWDVARQMLAFDVQRRAIDMDGVADALEAQCLHAGGARRDVRTFLHAELGPVLSRRRARLAELMARPQPEERPVEAWDTSTIILLETRLDENDTALAGLAPIEEEDPTEIDGR